MTVRGDRIVERSSRADFVIELGPGELRAGLINGHDHLFLNHYPRFGDPPYPTVYAWAADVQERFRFEIERLSRLSRGDALLFGALKNLVGGVTTVVHHDEWSPMFDAGFPLRVARITVAHSLGLERHWPRVAAARERGDATVFSMHLAEGVDDAIAEEIREAARRGLVDARLLAVHLVGIDPPGVALLERAGAGAVWCPTSNCFLYGRTAPPALFDSTIDILIGTDALLSGEGTMLDELRAARRLGYLDDARLESAVGSAAARRLGLPPPELRPGRPADLVLLRRGLFAARAADVALVVVAGKPRYGDVEFTPLFAGTGVPAEPLTVGGKAKLVASPLGQVAERVMEISPDCARIFD